MSTVPHPSPRAALSGESASPAASLAAGRSRALNAAAALVVAALSLAPRTVHAVGGPSPGAATAETVKLPSGPGSVRGLADDASVSGFTGQVQYAVPVEAPSGAGGMAPQLALAYDGEVGNGPLGIGWRLSMPVIQRSLRRGVPAYDGSDELELLGSGMDGELVAVAGGYRVTGLGNGAQVVATSSGGFELRTADGSILRFGTSAASRQGPAQGTAVWHLEQVEDVAGQTIDYTYRAGDGALYLEEVAWGPRIGAAPAFRIELRYENRADPVVSYRSGGRVAVDERIAGIDTWSFATKVRTLTLGYDQTFAVSRLASVTVSGSDGTSLPSLTFAYAQAQAPAVAEVPGLDGWALNLLGTSLLDIDGDGALDLVRLRSNGHSYRRNLGDRFGAVETMAGASGASLETVRLADLDGDSTAELVRQEGTFWNRYTLVAAGAGGAQWAAATRVEGTRNLGLTAVALADIDGDYRMDALSVSGTRTQVRLGGLDGLGEPESRPAIDAARSYIRPGASGTSFPDINGDGIADALYLAATEAYLYLGRGDGTFEPFRDTPYPWTGTITLAQIRHGDLDRDGLLDLVAVRAGHVEWYRGHTDGTFATDAVRLARPPGTDAAVVVTIADANGNGSEDIVWSSSAGLWVCDIAGATSAGMLVAVDNGLGKTQRFAYRASTRLAFEARDAGRPWTSTMPLSIPVATGQRLELASGDATRGTDLIVRDAVYDRTDRRFIGFLESTTTRRDPASNDEAQWAVLTQRYHPGLGADRVLRGMPLWQRTADGDGTVYRETTHTLEAVAVAGLDAANPRLRRGVATVIETRHLDGRSTALTTRLELDHDDEGRVTAERHFGRLDLAGDERIVRRRYTTGTSAQGVRDQVCEAWTYEPTADGGPVLRSHVQTLFGDDTSQAALCDASAGWVRRVQHWRDRPDAGWVTARAVEYDAIGNATAVENEGVRRTLVYDEHRLYPVEERLQPSPDRTLVWSGEWDAVHGTLLRSTDPNGTTTEATYDSLGRLVSDGPRGSPTRHIRYHWAGPRPTTEVFTYDGAAADVTALPDAWSPTAAWRHTVTVANSAGEPLFSATRLDLDDWIIAGARDRDGLGRTTRAYEVFAWSGTVEALATAGVPVATPSSAFGYDALDRRVTQTLANGTTTTRSFAAFTSTVTTSGLASVTSDSDGLGRIVHTERTVGGVDESVDAVYDATGRVRSLRLQDGLVTHSFDYNTLGQLIAATDPDIGDRQIFYDDGNRIVRQVNGAGEERAYAYDGIGRVTAVTSADATFRYHYDAPRDAGGTTFTNTAGRIAWVEEPTGTVQFGYDDDGNTVRFRRSVDQHTLDETTRYGASGLVLSVDRGAGVAFDVSYDPAGRPTAVGDLWAVLEQDAAGRILSERYGNGVVQTYQRDAVGLVSDVALTRRTREIFLDLAITRTPTGILHTVTDDDDTGLDHTARFEYDAGARLADAFLGAGDDVVHFEYRYDALQNMTSRGVARPGVGALTGTYVYGPDAGAGAARGPRQLAAVISSPTDGSDPVVTPFSYDAAGRQTTQGALSMDYNAFDQLVRVDGLPAGNGSVEHIYGHDGLRLKTRGPDGATEVWLSEDVVVTADGSRQHYVRLGDRLLARVTPPSAVAAAAAAAAVTAQQGLRVGAALALGLLAIALVVALVPSSRRRSRGRAAVTALAAVSLVVPGCGTASSLDQRALRAGGERLYFHQAVGTGPSVITRSDASIFEERRFEPFGEEIDAYQEIDGVGHRTTIDFARERQNILNKPSDPATGWSFHGARWMAPETARWLTPDPPVKAPDAGFMTTPWRLHPYQYVDQNPIAYWDPDGRNPAACLVPPVSGACAAAAAGVAATAVAAAAWIDAHGDEMIESADRAMEAAAEGARDLWDRADRLVNGQPLPIPVLPQLPLSEPSNDNQRPEPPAQVGDAKQPVPTPLPQPNDDDNDDERRRLVMYTYMDANEYKRVHATMKLPALREGVHPSALDGTGQYFTFIQPNTVTRNTLSIVHTGRRAHEKKFTHYVAVDVTDLYVQMRSPRGNVSVLPNTTALDISTRYRGGGIQFLRQD
jgi:RHS repeat-associated protein